MKSSLVPYCAYLACYFWNRCMQRYARRLIHWVRAVNVLPTAAPGRY